MNSEQSLKADVITSLIQQMSCDLQELLKVRGIQDPLMVGIHTGGVWIAQQLHSRVKIVPPLGTLDISFYRDDFTRIGINPKVKPSKLPFSIDDRHIILVDDVLHTGRTIRAALNELFDYGRPASVVLVTLVERSGRELPIVPDIVGKHMDLSANQHVKLGGPDDMQLVVSLSS